jgi:hypothetical protein
MITVKVPIGRSDTGSPLYQEYLQEWTPLQPLSYYIPEDLDGVEFNRIIWNGRSIPDEPDCGMKPVDPEVMSMLLNGYLPIDGDEIILVPGFRGPAFIPIAMFILKAVISMAIGMIISTIIGALTAPSKPKGQAMSNSATSYGWQGIQNSYGPGDPIPVIFGTHRASIKVIRYSIDDEIVYTTGGAIDLAQTKSYVNILGCLGQGKISAINDIRINDNPVSNFAEVDVQTRLGDTPQTPLVGFDEVKTTYQVDSDLYLTAAWQWAAYWGNMGQLVQPTVDNGFTYEITTLGVGGEVEPTWPAELGATVQENAEGGAIWTCRDDRRLTYTTTEGVGVTGYQVHLEAPRGLMFVAGRHGIIEQRIAVRIEDRVYGTSPWTHRGDYHYNAAVSSALRWSHKFEGLAANRYDVRVTFAGAVYYPSNYATADVRVDKITEIEGTTTETYDGRALIGIRALATAHLSDAPPTVTALVDGVMIPTWTGSAWVDAWTDNPAYIARAIMLNTKWGFGNWVPAAKVDDEAIKTFAAYCATDQGGGVHKHTCNFVWDQRRKMMDILRDVLGPARGMMFQAGGKFVVVADKVRTRSQLFTMGNIVKGSLQTEWIDETLTYNGYHVSYLSKNQNYKPFSFQADLGVSPLKLKNISLFGVTNGNEAKRDVTYQLNIAKYLHELISFEAGRDAVACLPGDVVGFAHETLKIGVLSGRAGADSETLNTITLDDPITLVGGTTYKVVVRFSGGDNPDLVETRTVANGAGTYTTLTVTTNFTQLVKQYDPYSLGTADTAVKDYMVVSLERKPNRTVALRCIEHNANVYTDDGVIDDSEVIDIYPDDVAPGPILTLDALAERQEVSGTQYVYNLQLNWSRPRLVVGKGDYLGANIYVAKVLSNKVLGTFSGDEGWTGGAINQEYGQYKRLQSYKVASVDGAWGYGNRTFPSALAFTDDDAFVGLWVYLHNRVSQYYNGDCLTIRLKTDDNNYFEYTKDRNSISPGANYVLIPKASFTEVGNPDWDAIPDGELGVRSAAGQTVYASFDSWYTFQPFSWGYWASVDGITWKKTSVILAQNYMLRVNPYSRNHVENSIGAYAMYTVEDYELDAIEPTGIEFVAFTSEGRNIFLKWSVPESIEPTKIKRWNIYRNETNDFATATRIDTKAGGDRSYRDLNVIVGHNYSYWLKIVNYYEVESLSPVATTQITHRHTEKPFQFDSVDSGNFPHDDGSIGYVGSLEVLDECDVVDGWTTDAAVDGSVTFEVDTVNKMQGTGSLKVSVVKYPKVRYYEDGVSGNALGALAGNQVYAQGFKLSTAKAIKAVGLKLWKYASSGPTITVAIYSNSGGTPGSLLGQTTIPHTSVPQGAYTDYIYGAFSSEISLSASTLYWLVISVTYTAGQWYSVQGYYGTTNQFGDSDEILKIGSAIGSLSSWLQYDINFRVGVTGDALNKFIYKTIAAKDLSAKTYLKTWLRSSRSGSFLSHSMGESAIGEQLSPITITEVNNFEWKASNISGVAGADRNAITKIGFKITNMDQDVVLNMDYFIANVGEPHPAIWMNDGLRYFLVDGVGRDAGQTLVGDILPGGHLDLQSTSDATKGGIHCYVGQGAAYRGLLLNPETYPAGIFQVIAGSRLDIAHNLYGDGANWNLYDTSEYGDLISIMSNTFHYRYTPPGSNPRTLSMGLQIASGVVTAPGVYSNAVGATYRDVYVDNTGQIGYLSSSERVKEEIEDVSVLSNQVSQLRPVRFEYSAEKGIKQLGFIAEEVALIIPEAVGFDENGKPVCVNHSRIVPLLVAEVQRLAARVATLEGGKG